MPEDVEFYRAHSPWSDPGHRAPLLVKIPPVPDVVVRAVSGLLLHPFLAPMRNVEVPGAASDDKEIRSVEAILDRLLSRDGSEFTISRAPQSRVSSATPAAGGAKAGQSRCPPRRR